MSIYYSSPLIVKPKTSNKAIGETSSKDSQEISYNVRTGANDTQQSKMRNSQLPMNPTKKEY